MTKKDLKMKEFMELYKNALSNPLIKNFMKNNEHYILVQNAIFNSTKGNKERVDNAFKDYYNKVKLIKYVSKLIHFFSIDYDKKVNRIKKNFPLTLDKPVTSDDDTAIVDLIEADNHHSFESAYGSTLKDHLENEKLIEALAQLTPKQLEILELIYLKNLSIKEVSQLFATSPQNISNQHRKSLKKLKNQLI